MVKFIKPAIRLHVSNKIKWKQIRWPKRKTIHNIDEAVCNIGLGVGYIKNNLPLNKSLRNN